MADVPFAWEDLARYKAEGRFLDGYPDDQRTFFAPGITFTSFWSLC
jgi:hypothetical protein